MKENVIQINGEKMINVDKSVKNVVYVKKDILGILLQVVIKNVKYLACIRIIKWIRLMKL